MASPAAGPAIRPQASRGCRLARRRPPVERAPAAASLRPASNPSCAISPRPSGRLISIRRNFGIDHRSPFQPTAKPTPSTIPQPAKYPTGRTALSSSPQSLDSPPSNLCHVRFRAGIVGGAGQRRAAVSPKIARRSGSVRKSRAARARASCSRNGSSALAGKLRPIPAGAGRNDRWCGGATSPYAPWRAGLARRT